LTIGFLKHHPDAKELNQQFDRANGEAKAGGMMPDQS
jgi:hypothetical protein